MVRSWQTSDYNYMDIGMVSLATLILVLHLVLHLVLRHIYFTLTGTKW
jgi:hypothetical protein